LFTLVLSLVTGVAVGLMPALQTAAHTLAHGLRSSGRAGRGGRRTRAGLVVAEIRCRTSPRFARSSKSVDPAGVLRQG
jgi:hypothetical protein